MGGFEEQGEGQKELWIQWRGEFCLWGFLLLYRQFLLVTGPEAPCILGIDFLQSGYFKDPEGLRWAFGIAAVETEGIKQLNTLPGLSENPSQCGCHIELAFSMEVKKITTSLLPKGCSSPLRN